MYLHWTRGNIEHLAKHDVTPDEAADIVRGARRPWPESAGDARFRVWGKTRSGRYLQVVFVYRPVDDILVGDIPMHWRGEVLKLGVVPMGVHARDLTSDEKRQLRRRG